MEEERRFDANKDRNMVTPENSAGKYIKGNIQINSLALSRLKYYNERFEIRKFHVDVRFGDSDVYNDLKARTASELQETYNTTSGF